MKKGQDETTGRLRGGFGRQSIPRRDRNAWVKAARDVLIANGIDRVKVEPLAQVLGVTTGSFYHHFKNRADLLQSLLEDWEGSNSEPIFRAVDHAGDDPDAQLRAVIHTWISEREYDPTYDSAVRAWAHSSKDVEAVVRRVDDRRIAMLTRIFLNFGYDGQRAFIRARIAYFHQVGYQAMEIIETNKRRLELAGLYREALAGNPPNGKTAKRGT